MTQRLTLSFAVLLVLLAMGCTKGKGPQGNPGGGGPQGKGPESSEDSSAKREFAVPVAVRALDRSAISEYVVTVGTVAPARSITVKAEDSGRLHFIKQWREGQSVKEGEMLALLDEEETSRAIEINTADLETARSQLELALARVERMIADFERAKVMFDLGQIARKAYEDREFQASSAQINYEEAIIRVQRAEKSLEQLRLQMDRKLVRAPMTGLLVSREAIENRANPTAADSAEAIVALEGRRVSAGTNLCGIVDTTNLLIRCDVTSKDIGKVRKGQKAKALIYSDSGISVEGEVLDVSPIMDLKTNAFKVDVSIPNPEGRLRPGMYSRVNIVIRTQRDALVVERTVLQRRNNQDIVFVIDDEDRAERRVVKIGLENPDEVEVVEGLRAGEKLVTLGFETLQDKIKVKIVEAGSELEGEDQATTPTAPAQPAEKKERAAQPRRVPG